MPPALSTNFPEKAFKPAYTFGNFRDVPFCMGAAGGEGAHPASAITASNGNAIHAALDIPTPWQATGPAGRSPAVAARNLKRAACLVNRGSLVYVRRRPVAPLGITKALP